MSPIEISSDEQENNIIESDKSINATTSNMEHFQQMIQLCKKNTFVPRKYIIEMNNMYKKCNDEQRSSKNLCNLILKGTKNITSKSKNCFQFAANVYNELQKLSKVDNLQTENAVASTSKGSSSINIESESEKKNISMSNKIFNEFIEKCYQNTKFPRENIEVVDKLYKSLAPEFVESKHFLLLLKEANQAIWPDSNVSLYTHVDHIYNQLLQFHTSMKIQDNKTPEENNKIDKKKLIKLQKLKIALKKIRKHIKILDEKEMDINDEDQFNSDSVYLLKDKFEKKIVEIYKKICDLTDEPNFLDEPRLHFKKTSNKLVNTTIETYYNQNKAFPDYFEIYTLLKVLNNKKNLNWTETQLKSISHDAFLKLGTQLKVKRLNEYFGRLSKEITGKDPAEDDEELKKKLDESKKKLNADLNAVTEEFKNKQDYTVETEDSSNSNDTDCEHSNEKLKTLNATTVGLKRPLSNNTENDEPKTISSEDESVNKSQNSNKKIKAANILPVRHKRKIKSSENDEPKKSKKSIHMEGLDLIPCATLNTFNVISNQEQKTNAENKKVSDEMVKENINDVINTNNSDGNITTNNVVEGESTSENEGDGILTIDENINIENKIDEFIGVQPTNEVREDGKSDNDTNINTITSDGEHNDTIDNDPNLNDVIGDSENSFDNFNIVEPEVTIHEEEIQSKDVIEINDHDDSDVEITSCDSPKVPVKKNLESIIKAMNFDKKYNWDPQIPRPNHSKSRPSHEIRYNRSGNPNPSNLNNNLVNRWVMNKTHALPKQYTKQIRPTNNIRQANPNNNRQHLMTPRMQSTSIVQNSTTQRGKNVTKHYNTHTTVQNRHHISNNRSIVQQETTTMTTTTMVRKIVQQTNLIHQRKDPSKYPVRGSLVTSSSHRSINNCTPELIELD